MTERGLESILKQLGRRYRFDRLIMPFGVFGLFIGVCILTGKLPMEMVYLAGCGVALFLAPVSVRRTAQTINQKYGDDPDVLCAVEHIHDERPSVQALHDRCVTKTRGYLNDWRLGWRWLWIGCALVWCVPMFVSTPEVWSVSESNSVIASSNDRDALAGSKGEGLAKAVPPTGLVKTVKSPAAQPSQPPLRKVAGEGKLAALEGSKSPKMVPGSASFIEGQSSLVLPGRGVGGMQTPGKLTETANPGTVELLGEDHLDPSEKYPVEYHEAIREWFLKRRN